MLSKATLSTKAAITMLTAAFISPAVLAVNTSKINRVLNEAGLEYKWSQSISLWIENPGNWTKIEMEKAGHMLCKLEQGFIVTWWQDIDRPRGQITKIKCM